MTEPFMTTSGCWAVRRYVPNRVALGVIMTTKAEGDWISLPFVSILASADVINLDGRRRGK